MSEEKNTRQEYLDSLKDKVAGDKEVNWKDVHREIIDNNYNLIWLVDYIMGQNYIKNHPYSLTNSTNGKVISSQLLPRYIEKVFEKDRVITFYRELKTYLLYNIEAFKKSEVFSKLFDYDELIERLDDKFFEVQRDRYEKAEKLISDDKAFQELEQLQLEYHKIQEALQLENKLEKVGLLETFKVDLLEQKGEDGDKSKN